MPQQPPDWKIGDPVYGLRLSPDTGLYVIRGEGRVIRIELPYIVLATRSGGEIRVGMTEWPLFNSREAAEAFIREWPSPSPSKQPMAHHTPPETPKTVKS